MMKKWIKLGFMACTICAMVTIAQSQETEEEMTIPDEETEAAPQPADIQNYMIRDGDTMWDICKIVLDNPWFWPKLWSLNQYILNPNLIRPGQTLAFSPSTDTSFPRMEVVEGNGIEEPTETFMGEPEPAEAAPAVSTASKFSAKGALDSEFLIEPSAQRGDSISVKLRSVTFLSPKDIDTVGKIVHSGEPKMNLVFGDKVYLDFYRNQPVKKGDKFDVIEKVKMVFDPDRETKKIGLMVRKKVELTVTRVIEKSSWRKRVVEATITDGDDYAIRGDEFVPAESDIVSLIPHYTDKNIFGKIVEADAEQFLISNNDFVYLNLGTKDGIQPGLQLYVVRTGDGLIPEEGKDLPDVTIAKLLIVESHNKTSTAYVTTLDRPLAVGDRVRSRVE